MAAATYFDATNIAGEAVIVNLTTRQVVGKDCRGAILARVCVGGQVYPVNADGSF